MNCVKHGWVGASGCPDCQTEAAQLEQHRTVFVEMAAIALWVGRDPVGNTSKDLDHVAKDCWIQSARLWSQRLL
jgi:hypothetical protein